MISQTQKEELLSDEEIVTGEVRPRIESFVESCLREVATPGVYLLSLQGGVIYDNQENPLLQTEDNFVNYGYLDGVNQLDVEKMELELNYYIEEELPTCLNNFNRFQSEGILVEPLNDLQVVSKVRDVEVVINLDYVIDVKEANEKLQLKRFSTVVPLTLGRLTKEAQNLINNYQEKPQSPNLLTGFAFVNLFPFDKENFIYSLSDDSQQPPLVFMFALKDESLDTAPVLNQIPDLLIQKGETLNYKLQASDADNNQLTFSSNHPLFPVTMNGKLLVSPEEMGTFQVVFTVTDELNNQDSQEVRIVVR